MASTAPLAGTKAVAPVHASSISSCPVTLAFELTDDNHLLDHMFARGNVEKKHGFD